MEASAIPCSTFAINAVFWLSSMTGLRIQFLIFGGRAGMTWTEPLNQSGPVGSSSGQKAESHLNCPGMFPSNLVIKQEMQLD